MTILTSMSAIGAHPVSHRPLPVPREGNHHRRPNCSGWCNGLDADADIFPALVPQRVHETGTIGPTGIRALNPHNAPAGSITERPESRSVKYRTQRADAADGAVVLVVSDTAGQLTVARTGPPNTLPSRKAAARCQA